MTCWSRSQQHNPFIYLLFCYPSQTFQSWTFLFALCWYQSFNHSFVQKDNELMVEIVGWHGQKKASKKMLISPEYESGNILSVLDNWVPLSPLLPGKGGNTTLKSPDTCGLYLEENQVRMTFKTLFRPQRIPKAATSYRLGEFALGGRIGNGCIIQIIILCSDIHSSHYLYAIANTEFWMGKGSGSAVPEIESSLDKVLTLLFLWTLTCSCLQSFPTLHLT